MSSKTVVIHQPDFLPYLGFFHRLINADLYVILDNVQFVSNTSRSWTKRDKIKTPQGEKWITVSVKKPAVETRINEVLLSDDVDWKSKNLNIISQNYRNAQYFSEIFRYVEDLYLFECQKLAEFNIKSIQMLMELFDLNIETIPASRLRARGKSNELLVEILKEVEATHYLSGTGARDYYDPLPYEEAGIQVLWQDFRHPVYPQLHGDFIPFLSSIDIFFNCGIERSREILRDV